MRIYYTSSGIIINLNNQYLLTEEKGWNRFVNRSNLPQAKSYNGATALGPCLLVTDGPIDPDTN
ncbi:hypothetical protein AY601_1249 [Pedobacter cryoconitis]|uniref:Uncharacterized protein n=1 Tax=Pedobacter cryoconitis TaxID=188932 RepID=A0A127V9V0_9SPHI|nr:hypothetical protein AY601_1249 [Pedobacter cryoconitis]